MRHPVTLFPTLIVCIGHFGARVGLRLKAILAQRPPEIHALFPMFVIADRPLQELNKYTVPDYIPLPRWREDEYIMWEPAPETRSRQEVVEDFSRHALRLQQRLEDRYQAMRDPNLHLQLGEYGFTVGAPVGTVQARLVVVASLTEALGAGIAFSMGPLLQEIVRLHGPSGSPVVALLNFTPWEAAFAGVSLATTYEVLRELQSLMDTDQPPFSRCYLLEAERQNGTRLSRLEDEAEMVASFLGLLLVSDLYQNEGLYDAVFRPPLHVPAEACCRRSAYAFATFCTTALVLPRHLLRIVMALRLGGEMFDRWQQQPEPDPRDADQWQQYFTASHEFTSSSVHARFLERLREIPETDYLPRIVWERVPREKWGDAIASADSFCGRYRIPVVVEQLSHLKRDILLPQFETLLREAVDTLVYQRLDGVHFARKALEELRKALEAVAQQMEEVVVLSTADLSSYRSELELAVANAPAWYTPFLYLLLPMALLTSCTVSADWGSLIKGAIVGAAWAIWLGVGSFTNWYHDTKIRRLREEYWEAVRRKWLQYLQAMCGQLTLEFFREASVLVQQEIARLDNLRFSIQTVRDLFESAQAEVLEEDFISKMNVVTSEQMQALYENRRPDPTEQMSHFLSTDLRTIGWRQSHPDRLGETLFRHTFALWDIFQSMSVEQVMAADVPAAQHRLTQLRERLSVLLRLPRVWLIGEEQSRMSVGVHERLLLALADAKDTVLAEYVSQPAQQSVDLISTSDQERVTWVLLWANFPMEVVESLSLLRRAQGQNQPPSDDEEQGSTEAISERTVGEGMFHEE